MKKPTQDPIEINISPEKVCYIIVKAREFDAKVEPTAADSGDDPETEILEDFPDDLTRRELQGGIRDLNEDEIVDLIAIAWVGRGDFGRDDFEDARSLAMERHRPNSAPYLMGMPALGDYLEEGLSELGYSCEDTEAEHL